MDTKRVWYNKIEGSVVTGSGSGEAVSGCLPTGGMRSGRTRRSRFHRRHRAIEQRGPLRLAEYENLQTPKHKLANNGAFGDHSPSTHLNILKPSPDLTLTQTAQADNRIRLPGGRAKGPRGDGSANTGLGSSSPPPGGETTHQALRPMRAQLACTERLERSDSAWAKLAREAGLQMAAISGALYDRRLAGEGGEDKQAAARGLASVVRGALVGRRRPV